jgi:hypothetical protein
MRAWLVSLVVLAALAAAPAPARAQVTPKVDPDAPTIAARVDRSKVQLGEPFHLVITVVHKPDMTVNLPAGLELGDGFSELGKREESRRTGKDGLVSHDFVVTVGALETGAQTIPGVAVGYEVAGQHRQITSTPITVEVTSLVGGGKEELRPVAQPITVLERDWTLLWVMGGVAGAAARAGAAWIALRKARETRPGAKLRSGKTTPPLAADEAALARLRALASSGKLDADDRRPVYFELSEIMKEYLGARYGFDALELTSEELLAALALRAPVEVAHEVGQWVQAGDLIRYARVPTTRDEAAAALAQAVTLVERTRVVVAAPAPAEPPPPPPAAPEAPV